MRTLPPARTRLRVGDPGDLLALVPYLLGFHPAKSVVAVFLRAGHVLLTARVDLPPPGLTDVLVTELADLAEVHEVTQAVVIAYSSDDLHARAVLGAVVERLDRVRLADAILVVGDRWWSTLCAEPCCPAVGRPYEVETHRLAAEAVYAGMTARADRTELETLVAGPGPDDAARLERLARALQSGLESLSAEQAARLVETTMRTALVEGVPSDESARLTLILLISDVRLRDLAWASLTRKNACAQVDLWTEVVAVAPPALASAPICLLGLAAWVNGDGALQNCCIARVRSEDPNYSLGALLADISERALSPSVWDELLVEMRAELGLPTG